MDRANLELVALKAMEACASLETAYALACAEARFAESVAERKAAEVLAHQLAQVCDSARAVVRECVAACEASEALYRARSRGPANPSV